MDRILGNMSHQIIQAVILMSVYEKIEAGTFFCNDLSHWPIILNIALFLLVLINCSTQTPLAITMIFIEKWWLVHAPITQSAPK